MNIVKLQQNFYRTTAYVVASIDYGTAQLMVYDGEMVFRMQPSIDCTPIPPMKPFCRTWLRDQALGLPDGISDQEASLQNAIVLTIIRRHQLKLRPEAVVDVMVQIIQTTEQEEFHMEDLHPHFQNSVIHFAFNRWK